MGAGKRTNLRAELLAMWGLLFFALKQHCLSIKIYGDSKFITDWAKEKHTFHTMEVLHRAKENKGSNFQFS